MLSRLLLHSDIHLGNNVRFFFQLQGSNANGKISSSPVDENPLDIHQGFAEFNMWLQADTRISIRAGRQELSYGSQRLIAVRELPNNRQSFDAVKFIVTNKNFKADILYGTYVRTKKGIFDDDYSDATKLWSVYLVKNNVPWFRNIDLYYIGMEKEHARFDDGSGRELRNCVGIRIWAQKNNWRYDLEGVYQFGTLDDKNISAWTLSSNVGYTVSNVVFTPEIGLKAELISGDRHINDNEVGTFNPLFPRGAYFGLAALIGPSNLMDIHPSISFHLHHSFVWTIDYDVFWRYSTNDGIYAPNVSLIYSGALSERRWIGDQLATDLLYSPIPNLNLKTELTWFHAGDFLEDAGPGKDILFGGITIQVKF
jgi:hypothetical protein